MKYLVLGDNNGLGLEVIKELDKLGIRDVAYYSDKELDPHNKNKVGPDLFRPNKLEKYIKYNKPEVIIDLYEDKDMERAEQGYFAEDECNRKNVTATENLVEASKLVNAKIIYLSSDQVYSGVKSDYNSEDDYLDSPSIYGACKINAEQLVKSNPKHFIVRPGMIYGGTTDYIDELVGKKVSVVEAPKDEIVSPVNISYLARVIIQMSSSDKYGTYNVADYGACSKYEFAVRVRNGFRSNYSVLDSDNIPSYIAKNRALNTNKLEENGFETPEFWLANLANHRKERSYSDAKVLKKK